MTLSRKRQELYNRIRQSSKQEVILEEMIRLGFWPRKGEIPDDPADEIRRRGEIRNELDALRTEQKRLKDTEAMLREVKKQRMADSRRRQQETRERHERERIERARAWRSRQDREIVYLGEEVSGGLNGREGDNTRLEALGLPLIQSPEAIADFIGISVNTLRFITYNRKVSKVSNYIRFEIPKKTGGMRRISAPRPTLKFAQRRVLENILSRVPCHEAAQGFLAERSIVSNALPHVGADIVINLDLRDFFPTIGYRRVKGLFRSLGYSDSASTVFALICTEPHTEEIEIDGQTRYVAVGERVLPQGAPSSPAITNLICRRMDKALSKVAGALGFTYTRYADDLSFSAKHREDANIGRLLRRVAHIIDKSGFRVNDNKTRILRKSRRQEVTGIVVNEKPGIDRRKLKAFRAVLYQIEKDGPEGKKWGNGGNVLSAVWGYASFVAMVDPAKGNPLRDRVRTILDRHGWAPPEISEKAASLPETVPGRIVTDREAETFTWIENGAVPETESATGSAHPKSKPVKKKPWWKFW